MIEKDYVGNAMKEFFKDAGIEVGEIDYQPDGEVTISFIDANISFLTLTDFEGQFRLNLGSYDMDGDRIANCEFNFIE